ncbi:hypothetical protein BN946_scf184988.g3 [Trametes cinnabarina]|uniref:Uncharacterized protein n=1 Tax=Pycnoporus cinnabarinus TaxID=5643 RepID=A0A060SL55_PYCCI|nr:hypothetical protein BN946_scf184988.g3 [Trametes cinnabarina]
MLTAPAPSSIPSRDAPPLSARGPVRPNRKWRTSLQVPFAAQMVWEKFTCAASFKGPQVRLVLNDAPFPLSTCVRVDRRYGSCAVADFVASYKASAARKWGDAVWNATCGTTAL